MKNILILRVKISFTVFCKVFYNFLKYSFKNSNNSAMINGEMLSVFKIRVFSLPYTRTSSVKHKFIAYY